MAVPTSCNANLGQKFPLFGYVQSFILHARLPDQTNRMHGPTASNLCSSDYSAICSKEIFFFTTRTVPARNVDGRGITSNWFIAINCLFMRPERSQNRTEPTKKSMCDMCGYYGHVWHISHAPLKITTSELLWIIVTSFGHSKKLLKKQFTLSNRLLGNHDPGRFKIWTGCLLLAISLRLLLHGPWHFWQWCNSAVSPCPCPLQEYTQSLP